MQINISITQQPKNKIKITTNKIEDKPNRIKIDSLSKDINKRGFPSYVEVLARFDDSEFPTLLRSIDGKSYSAEMFSISKMEWVPYVELWHKYVDTGLEGLDYKYLSEKEFKEIVPIEDKVFS